MGAGGPGPLTESQPAGPPNLGAAVDPFAPTDRPEQPITAGMEPNGMMAPDPTDALRAMYRRFPYPDIRRLLERSQMTDWQAMASQESPPGMEQAAAMGMEEPMAPDPGMGGQPPMDPGGPMGAPAPDMGLQGLPGMGGEMAPAADPMSPGPPRPDAPM